MNDLKFAFRQLRKNPGFTTVAVLTVALGIGANTAIFSVVNAVLLRPLPLPESDRLACISEGNQKSREFPISFPDFTDWQAQQTVFDLIGVYNWGAYNLTGSGDPQRLWAAQMTASALAALRAQPALGRVFTPDEDKPGVPHVVVLSHELWQNRFGDDPAILNQAINLDGVSYTIGLYGVLVYAVTQRRREIGVRIALGAQRSSVLRLVIGNGMRLVVGGMVFGMAGAAFLTRVMRSLLFDVAPFDPVTLVAVPVLLSTVALLACWLPARKAGKLDPMEALRYD